MKSISSLLKSAPPTTAQKAKLLANKVRELEEIEKRKFIAFVDDGPDSFDVAITLSTDAKSVSTHTCDCDDGEGFCAHQYAVLSKIKDGPSESADSITIKKLRKKKLTEVEIILDEVSDSDLRSWLQAELAVNKELEFKFKSAFIKTETRLTAKEFDEKCAEIIKTTMGKRKTIDPSLLPRILDLVNIVIESGASVFSAHLVSNESYELQVAIGSFHAELQYMLKKTTTRIVTNYKRITEKIGAHILLLSPADQIKYFHSFAQFLDQGGKNIHFAFQQFIDLLSNLSDEVLVDTLSTFSTYKSAFSKLEQTTLISLLDEIEKRDLFSKTSDFFETKRYENAYNLRLMSLLLKAGKYKKVISFCAKAVKENHHAIYSIPYLKLMIPALEAAGEQDEVIDAKLKLFKAQPNYENYMSTKNSNLSADQEEALEYEFYKFQLTPNTANYQNLLDLKFNVWMNTERETDVIRKMSSSLTAVFTALPFLPRLYKVDKTQLLKKIIEAIDKSQYSEYDEEDVHALVDFITSNYSKDDLAPYVRHSFYFGIKNVLFRSFGLIR